MHEIFDLEDAENVQNADACYDFHRIWKIHSCGKKHALIIENIF